MVAEPDELLGSQEPTHKIVAPALFSRGPEAIELAGIAGITLDPWQQQLLHDGLGVIAKPGHAEPDLTDPTTWNWAAFEAGVELSRQNGKSAVLEVRALAGVYLFGERLVVYSAHKGETAMEAFRRLDDVVHSDPELAAEVLKVSNTNGKEFIRLRNGATIKFRTRTSGGGRGLSGDCVILDEAQDLGPLEHGALMPVVSARPNPQLWYAGSAGDQDSVVQGRLVRRCTEGSARLTYYRWAASPDDDRDDPATWARVNPAFGRRITIETVAAEHAAMDEEMFDRERLGIGNYPRAEGEDWAIPRSAWLTAQDPDSCAVGPIVIGVDVRPTRAHSSVGWAGWRPDGRRHIEVARRDVGSRWVIDEVRAWVTQHDVLAVTFDEKSAAAHLHGELVDALADTGVRIVLTDTAALIRACGDFLEAVTADRPLILHGGGTVLTSSVASASTRPIGDGGWAWSRRGAADITPLMSVTLAAHVLHQLATDRPTAPPPPPRIAGRSSRSPAPARRRRADLDPARAGF